MPISIDTFFLDPDAEGTLQARALQALGKRDFGAMTADYFDGDDPKLLEFIARQILPRRGILAGQEEVLVTMGAQNALWLTSHVLLNSRRRATIEAEDFLVVEDDYEFEMSFLKAPSPSLKSLDQNGRVIYVGSFSKSLFPGLRLGYLVGPAPFIQEARALRASVLRHPPGQMQRTVAYYLSLGHYDALVRRMSRAYQQRREVIDASIAHQGLTIAGEGSFGGSAVWMKAPETIDTAELAAQLRRSGVLIEPGAAFFDGPSPPTHYFRLAYSSIPSQRIADGIGLIAEAISQNSTSRH